MRAPFLADFAMGRRPISQKPSAGFVTERTSVVTNLHLLNLPPNDTPQHTVALWWNKGSKVKGWCVHGATGLGVAPSSTAMAAQVRRHAALRSAHALSAPGAARRC